ncbi:WSC-domain-containing protein [Pleurostoma richardsiae]|uniref:WSC-domain-containing protein n=1 Tax=Pleurostoma richardsiae TaxID=41990 RepID=A0AA38VHR0_9PEZI|nr:WSC-domain-containing protein [Pleurostoma richardsiae]
MPLTRTGGLVSGAVVPGISLALTGPYLTCPSLVYARLGREIYLIPSRPGSLTSTMRHGRLLVAAAAILAELGRVDAYWRMSCGIIQVGRVDPIISPGTVSGHVHKIAGGSSITINSTYESLQESDCTSCTIQADKSAYWTPALYFLHADGTYEAVPNTGMTVYYLGRGTDAYGNATATPFPPGLQMLSGDNTARTQDLTTMTWGNSTYPARLVSEAVSMVCINYEDETGSQTVNMTNMNCPDGFRAQIQMQTCWDGVNLYLSDQSHVAHLSQIDNGVCPPSHPVLLPHLFYEVFYTVTSFEDVNGTFVFANGDETGFGFHGDFLNGWDIPTLTQAIDECLVGNVDGVVADCAVFDATNDANSPSDCPQQSPIFPCEPVSGIISKLPGCITPTGYGAVVTLADIECSGGNTATCNATASHPPEAWTGDSAYSPLGCYTEASSGRALTAKSYISAANMTALTCEAYCYGYKYFGIEYSEECYCGDSISTGSVLTDSSQCDMDCTGDEWQICGGSDRLNMYEMNASVYTAAFVPNVYPGDSLFESLGCYTEATGGRALRSKSYTSSTNMTAQNCEKYCAAYDYFGVEWSQECYCGNKLNTGSVNASASQCEYLCTGDDLQYCGGSSHLNIFRRIASSSSSSTSTTTKHTTSSTAGATATSKATPVATTSRRSSTLAYSRYYGNFSTSTSWSAASATATTPAFSTKYAEPLELGSWSDGLWEYQGCFTEATSSRALSSAYLYGTSTSNTMDLDVCANYCFNAGYTMFGVEYAEQCFCGDSLNAGSAWATDQDDCSMACAANASQYCGGGDRLNVYALAPGSGVNAATGFSTKYAEPAQVAGGWTYTGCYNDSVADRALSSATLYGSTSTINMTVEVCVAYCNQKGYTVAGVEYGQQCYCGDELGAGSVFLSNQNGCDMVCAGNSSEYCGGSNRLNVFVLESS